MQVSQLLFQQSTQVYCTLYFFRKLKCRRTFSGSAAIPAHATATAMHFPANAGLIFLTDELTNDRFLVDTGATLSTIPCTSNSSPSGPLLKGADGQPIPSWGFIQKTVQFQGKLFTSSFLQAAVAGPILGIDFLRKFKVKVVPETSHVLFACTVAAPSVPPRSPSSVPEAVPLFARPTSSQPAAISAQLVRNPEVKFSSFSFRNDQSVFFRPHTLCTGCSRMCPH